MTGVRQVPAPEARERGQPRPMTGTTLPEFGPAAAGAAFPRANAASCVVDDAGTAAAGCLLPAAAFFAGAGTVR